MGLAKRWAEELAARGYDDVEGSICLTHVIDPALEADLREEITPGVCGLCGEEADEPAVVPVETLMATFIESFRYFFTTSDELPWDNEDGVYVGPQFDTREAVYELAADAFEPAVIDDALELVSSAIGDDNEWTTWGTAADTDDLDYEWTQFAETVKHEARFVFLDDDTRHDPTSRFLRKLREYVNEKNGLVRSLPAGTPVFRGRLCEKPGAISPTAEALGPAPRGRAAANRMSPQGISLFYGSSDPETAVAEIAGHGVDPLAVVGRFITTRDLTVLDLTVRPRLPSPFDQGRRREYRMLSFLGSFVSAITAPVIPDGRQHVEYVPTQVVTEYLRRVAAVDLDGIVLPSVQTGRQTFVLFFDSDGVANGTDEPTSPSLRDELLGLPAAPPAAILDPSNVATYRVTRTYGIEPLYSLRGASV
ncbi:HEPN-associated N-terminal domain-containing protein [Nocardioides pelophilus]|uniref:HEPN-associated N-terminal domain-containing protein n=1 Tax=Nocardioides pelophilus TaxID=2172019 RepID=UPI001603FB34|nr:HEPN-associated N-terminal domain-containing protein [Nocardioides pelophilus]